MDRTFTADQIRNIIGGLLIGETELTSEWVDAIADRGIDIADDGNLTILTEYGQRFKVTVTEQ